MENNFEKKEKFPTPATLDIIKIDKAKKYGVKIINESDLVYILGDDYRNKSAEKKEKKEENNKNTNVIDSI